MAHGQAPYLCYYCPYCGPVRAKSPFVQYPDYLYILWFVCSCARVCVCVYVGFFLPQNVFFKLFLLDYGMTEVFTHSLSFVYKVNVELTSYRLSN